jgi:glucose/arabinose dehydrogenase
MLRLATLIVSGTLVLAGCGGSDSESAREPSRKTPSPSESSSSQSSSPSESPPASRSATPASSARPKVIGTIARDLQVPWGIAFLPDGSALVTERDSGRVLRVTMRSAREVGRVAETRAEGEAGLLGVALSPSYAQDKRVFFYTTAESDNRVLRTTFDNDQLGKMQPILTGIPKAFNHDGGRMVFGPDRMLYVSTGESGQPDLAQDRGSLGGKILRITQDGDPAPGNPDRGSPIWTWGHRNVQGLAFDDNGNLWASEFGQDTFDELNLIEKGRNYGWPTVEGVGDEPGLQNPQVTWSTDEASPSGLAFAGGRLWLGALRGERVWRVDVNGRKAGKEKGFLVGEYGRMRTVVTAPDGNLWVTTSNHDGRGDPAPEDDRILLVRP